MHLPANYIYNDVELKSGWFEQVTEKYKNAGYYSQTAKTRDNKTIMRFYKGMSYLWIPPFIIGHLYAKSFGYDADGFSPPYHTALIFYGALFSILGVVMSRKILRYYFNEKITALTLILFFTGTSIFYFISLGSDTPHVYLFTLFASLIYWTIKWHEQYKYKYIILLGISLGLIIAIRPSDMFIAVVPIFWGVYNKLTLKAKIDLLLKEYKQILLALLICGLFILPQLVYYYKFTGSPIINIYDNSSELFDFMHPKILSVLFGFRKGWFIYSPLILLGFLGLILMIQNHKDYVFISLLYFSLLIYLIASFNSLNSFGWRAFIQSGALLVLPTAFFVDFIFKRKIVFKVILSLVVFPLILLNIHQAYQFKQRVLHGSQMTREYYFAVLGKNSVSDEDKALLLTDQLTGQMKTLPKGYELINRELAHLTFENTNVDDPNAPDPHGGNGMYLLDKNKRFSPGYKNSFNKICKQSFCYIKMSAYVYSDTDVADSLYIIFNTKCQDGKSIKYDGLSLRKGGTPFITGQWQRISSYGITPEISTGEEIIEAYFCYLGVGKVWLDDLTVEVYEPMD